MYLNLYLRKDIRRTYNKIIVDPSFQLGMYYTCDYITTNFNFKIVTKGEGTSKTESFKLDFENGKYSIRKED